MEVSGVGREFSEGTNNGTERNVESRVREVSGLTEKELAEKRFEVQDFTGLTGADEVKRKTRLILEKLRAQRGAESGG